MKRMFRPWGTLRCRMLAEVAEIVGWTRTMVKVQAYRARSKLKRLVKKAVVEGALTL